MITRPPTEQEIQAWKALWARTKGQIEANRKSGGQLLEYLRERYPLTEIFDPAALAAIADNVTMNEHLAEKLPEGSAPAPRAFFLENEGAGKRFYLPENRDDPALWGDLERLFVGVDLSSGFYMVEGSTLLWDELCAFQGVDERDLQNFVIVAQYIRAQRRMRRGAEQAQ